MSERWQQMAADLRLVALNGAVLQSAAREVLVCEARREVGEEKTVGLSIPVPVDVDQAVAKNAPSSLLVRPGRFHHLPACGVSVFDPIDRAALAPVWQNASVAS